MIQFYGKADMNKEGRVTSEYPGWYLDNEHIDELKRGIDYKQTLLDNGLCPPTEVGVTRTSLAREKDRLNMILESKPVLSADDKTKLAKIRKALGEEIKASMYTRSDMQKGVVDDHEEVRRMTEPIIDVTGEVYDVVKASGVAIYDGKVSREGAIKPWKLIGKLLGEPTDVETLRKS